jgi:ubiquinone/menaquinone biosynthesis C-methylase UbiE
LDKHPYLIVNEIIKDARKMFSMWKEIQVIEDPGAEVLSRNQMKLEEGHHELFQKLWVNFSPDEYRSRIERYDYRLKINNLKNLIDGAKCIDFGCGHGNFAHALLNFGAKSVYGLDYGKESLEFATKARDALNVSEEKISFHQESVYETKANSNSFDFAVQNGVFHHLEDENKAIKEVHRVLKKGGWVWYYTDGSGGIGYDLFDASVEMLRDIPQPFVIAQLKHLNLETGKRYHLGDGMNAVYRHTTYEEITGRLSQLGFGNFKRMDGGFPTDFDRNIIAEDKYGKEKFGSGDIRVIAQKL